LPGTRRHRDSFTADGKITRETGRHDATGLLADADQVAGESACSERKKARQCFLASKKIFLF
jgi:hypothetical protein